MTPDEALADIRGYASSGRIRYSEHAYDEMAEANATRADVRHALTNAATCVGQDAGRWKVIGPDWDGDDLTAIVVLEDGVLVVTVW